METGGNITTHFFTIRDAYENPASSAVYSVEASIDGGGLVFEETNSTTLNASVIE